MLIFGLETSGDHWFPTPTQPTTTKLRDYPRLSNVWSLDFEIMPAGVQGPQYSSIVHMTNGADLGSPGNRYPAIYVQPDRQSLAIRTTLSGNDNYAYQMESELNSDIWTKVSLSQSLSHGFYIIYCSAV